MAKMSWLIARLLGRARRVTARRSLPLLLISLLLALGLLFAPGSAEAIEQRTLDATNYPAADLSPTLAQAQVNVDIVRQGYDLLLDRYVQPLGPADLLVAAYDGLVKGLAEAGVAIKRPGAPALPSDREAAWTAFREAVSDLLQESPPPAGFNPNAVMVAAMARSVNEGHTNYMTPKQYQDFLAFLRGDVRYGGIGVRPKRPGVTVAEVFPGSPAEAAGVLVGDMITSVDGQPTAGRTLDQVTQQIRGAEGTAVTLEVERPRTGERLLFVIVRASIKVEYISTEIIQGDIAYVRLLGFSDQSVADRFDQFLGSLPEIEARGLVIDLRGNSGGRIDVGLRILNRFIAAGPLFDQVDRTGRHHTHFATGPGWLDPVPVAILIDEASASMSEIFAAAMHENGLARLIGKKTAGNVAGSQVFPLSDGSGLQVTTLELLSGGGRRLNRDGVEPDLVADTSREELEIGRDIPLEAAVLYLWEQSVSPVSGATTP
jgi:carboxyl-terminal processing protease